MKEHARWPHGAAAEFAALEPFGDGILATEPERYAKRLASSMAEMQAFYDAAFPRLERRHGLLRQVPARRPAGGREGTCCT